VIGCAAARDRARSQQLGLRPRIQSRKVLEGGSELFVAKTVLLELEWVMRGLYQLSPGKIARTLAHLLALPNVEIEDRPGVSQALANLRTGLDFADALHHQSR
jgi:predicted nucleic-acid-binding protein